MYQNNQPFIKDNNLAELTDVLSMKVPGEDVTVNDKILPGFTDNSIIKPYGDGKTYLMPMFYAPCICQFFINGKFYSDSIMAFFKSFANGNTKTEDTQSDGPAGRR